MVLRRSGVRRSVVLSPDSGVDELFNCFMKKVNLERLREIPILEVAEALGMELMKEGSTWAMRDPNERKAASSLTIFPGSNRWKRWSGVVRGGVSQGSVIDLVMHMRDNSDLSEAIEFLKSRFPNYA